MDTDADANPLGGLHHDGAVDSPPPNMPPGRALDRRGDERVGIKEL